MKGNTTVGTPRSQVTEVVYVRGADSGIIILLLSILCVLAVALIVIASVRL